MGGGGEDICLRRIKSTKERISASVKQKDWSLAESLFTFGNRYKFISCAVSREALYGGQQGTHWLRWDCVLSPRQAPLPSGSL